MDVTGLVDEVDAALRALGTPERAEKEAAYLKSSRRHYGVTMPAIRSVAKGVRRDHPDLGHDDLLALAAGLWDAGVHERCMAAVELLDMYGDRLACGDFGFLEGLLRDAGTWALVDSLAASVVGPLVERCPSSGAVLDRWAADDDFWIRRSAMLALLLALRRGGGDWDRFCRYADAMLDETEFFIRKAIGWIFRDTARKRPDMVFEWFLPRARRASGVTTREVLKRLSDDQRAAILAAR